MLEPGARGVNAAKKDLGAFTGRFETKVGSHDVAMLKITAKFRAEALAPGLAQG